MITTTMRTADDGGWNATLTLLRWRQTRRGYEGDDALLATGFSLLESDAGGRYGPETALRQAEAKCNIPADRIATELIHLALLLITKPRRNAQGETDIDQSRAVLRLLHLGLKAVRGTSPDGVVSLSIPLNACNLLLTAMADTLDSVRDGDAAETTRAVNDVLQIFIFLFGMTASEDSALSTPSFNMYKPPTNVYTAFMQHTCKAIFAQLDRGEDAHRASLVRLAHATMRVFQELQFTQLNKKKVFMAIAKTSFRDIVSYRHALHKHQGIEGVHPILDLLDRIIVDALFDSEHLREYDGALVSIRMWQEEQADGEEETEDKPKSKKQKRKQGNDRGDNASSLVSYQRHVFDEIKAFLADKNMDIDAKESIGALLEVLVAGYAARIRAAANEKIEDTRAELKTSKKRVANVIAVTSTTYSPFKFWAELCGVAVSAFEAQGGAADPSAVALLVCTFDSLFKALCDADVYRVTEDTEEQEQFHMMQKILSRLIEVLRGNDTKIDGTTTTRACQVISNAVRCTPNLVNSSLISIFEVLGGCSHERDAAAASMVELLRAYESMRLIDAFLKSCCATDDEDANVATGLRSVFAHTETEAALRRTFMTLPPGQLEIVWRLMADKVAVLCGSRNDKMSTKMSLIRFLFAVFIQEIHITPQNRPKIGELLTETHEKLLAILPGRLKQFDEKSSKKSKTKPSFTVAERELFSLFGELLALYDGLSPVIRSKTLGVVLEALSTSVSTIIKTLLAGENDEVVGAAVGIIKIGVHWLRRKDREVDNVANVIASLIIDRVVHWKCWDAVAFYLPELLDCVSSEQAGAFYSKLLSSYLQRDAAASRILHDAAFYEVSALRDVAPLVFTQTLSSSEFSVSTKEMFFDYLLVIPASYIAASHDACGTLLSAALRAHMRIAKETDPTSVTVLPVISSWIQQYLLPIASVHDDKELFNQIASWTEFFLLESKSLDNSTKRLINSVIHFLGVSNENSPAHGVLSRVSTKLLAQKSHRGLTTSAVVLESIASIHQQKLPVDTRLFDGFVESMLSNIQKDKSILSSYENTSSFDVMTALVKYLASNPDGSKASVKIVALLQANMSAALAVAMQTIVNGGWEESDKLASSRYNFFSTFCSAFYALRHTVTLETFGCLLAVALVLASSSDEDSNRKDQPLMSLVQHAHKDEFHLLISTVLKELHATKPERVVSALKALVFVLETDKKLSASRRQVLSEHKNSMVQLMVLIFARAQNQETTDLSSAMTEWNLRVFTLFYCKAELFTWKQPHELLQIFSGFQPLTMIASQSSLLKWTPAQIHHIWLLSYNLLLRIVRHHFASLVNGISHMVDALNTLLRVLITTSAQPSLTPEQTAHTLEWSSNLARLYGYLKPQDAALRKHVVYLLITYLRGVTQGKLSLALQHKLRPGIFTLLEICSMFEKEQLYASLDSTGKSLLKSIDTSYKLTYRYAGKV